MPLSREIYLAVRGTLLTLPFVIHLLGADALISLLLPFSPLFPGAVYALSSALAAPVWRHIQSIFTGANGAAISISSSSTGARATAAAAAPPLPKRESAIVVANHVSWTDFYMIQALAIRSEMLQSCRWFAKVQLKWVPLLGWGLWAMGFPLITRNWTTDRAEMERVFGGICKGRWPVWLIAYSEATRFTPAKHAETVRWCEAQGRAHIPKHTLVPRYRGFVATVQQLRRGAPHVKAVYDLTIAYAAKKRGKWEFMCPPSMWQSLAEPGLSGGGRGEGKFKFLVNAERFALDDLPQDDEGLRKWLEERWVVKDQLLEKLRLDLEEGRWV